MADGALGSPDRPAYLDPFTEIVGISGFGSQFVVVPLAIARASTLAFQQGKVELQAADATPGNNVTDEPPTIATQCRYIWQSQRPTIVSGTLWRDQDENPPVPTLQARSEGSWKTIKKKRLKISGLPNLPTTVPLSGVLGTSPLARADLFAPQAHWDDLPGAAGSNAFSEFPAPGGGSWVRTGAVTIRIIGQPAGDADRRFIPEGAYVPLGGVYTVTQQPLNISVGGITVTDGKRTWKGFAACKVPGSRPPESPLLPESPGVMQILCAGPKNKRAFPRG